MRTLLLVLLIVCYNVQAQTAGSLDISPNPVASGGLVSGTFELSPAFFVVSDTPEPPPASVEVEGTTIKLVVEVIILLAPGPDPTEVPFEFIAPAAGTYDVEYEVVVVEPFPGVEVFQGALGNLVVIDGGVGSGPRTVSSSSIGSLAAMALCLLALGAAAFRHRR